MAFKSNLFNILFKPNIQKCKDRNDIKGLIKVLLYADNVQEENVAIESLVKIGEPAVYSIIQTLLDYGKSSYESNFKACGRLYKALKIIGEPSVKPLIRYLRKDESPYGWLPRTLGAIGKVSVEPLVQVLLTHEDQEVRRLSAVSLGYTMDPRAIDPLILVLSNYYEQGRDHYSMRSIGEAAACALIEIGKPAVEPFIQVIEKMIKRESICPNKSLQRSVADLLVVINTAYKYGMFSYGLENSKYFIQRLRMSKNPYVQEIANNWFNKST